MHFLVFEFVCISAIRAITLNQSSLDKCNYLTNVCKFLL